MSSPKRLGRRCVGRITDKLGDYIAITERSVEGYDDTGIDVLGTLLIDIDGKNKVHWEEFFAQVKGTNDTLDNWSEDIEVKTVKLWLTRDLPVFIIVCFMEQGNFYFSSIEERREELFEKIKSGQKTIRFSKEHLDEIDVNDKGISEFRLQVISSRRRNFERIGRHQFGSKFTLRGSGYYREYPEPMTTDTGLAEYRYIIRVVGMLRAMGSIERYLQSRDEEFLGVALESAKAAWAVDRSHWEVPYHLGVIHSMMGDVGKTIYYANISKEIIKTDPHSKNSDSAKRNLQTVEGLLELCKYRIMGPELKLFFDPNKLE